MLGCWDAEADKEAKEALRNLIDYMMNLSDEMDKFFEKVKYTSHLRSLWHVPIEIKAPPMPDIPIPRMVNIRSEL